MNPSRGARYLVTGALGCIGAWTVRALVQGGTPVVAFDLGADPRRLRSIMSAEEIAAVDFVTGDITDLATVERALDGHGVTHVIHLAALQVPFCKADPPLGASVNIIGTVNVFEAVRRRERAMGPVVYTSSIGMYGPADVDPATGRLAADATAHPLSHYGVYKLANEGNARVYWLDGGVSSIGLRPLTVFGVGRDQGLTSGPTKAIAAAVLGRHYTVPFGGTTLFQYAEDVARILIAASRSDLEGANVFNLPGVAADGEALKAAIESAAPGRGALIDYEPVSLPFPASIDHDGIEVLGELPLTSFDAGVRSTVEIYQDLAARGELRAAEHGLSDAPP